MIERLCLLSFCCCCSVGLQPAGTGCRLPAACGRTVVRAQVLVQDAVGVEPLQAAGDRQRDVAPAPQLPPPRHLAAPARQPHMIRRLVTLLSFLPRQPARLPP
jgi:hypothetical protein